MRRLHNPKLVKNSRVLRKNMTEEEKELWYGFLRKLSVPIYRQRVIGNYIVDFCCPSAKIVIELDGSQHYEDANKKDDEHRDKNLSELGYKVLRYTNRQISENFENVCEDIYCYVIGCKR